jgi:hypothetical protein
MARATSAREFADDLAASPERRSSTLGHNSSMLPGAQLSRYRPLDAPETGGVESVMAALVVI